MSNLLEKASIVTTPTAYDNGKILSVKPAPSLGSELVTNGDFATDSDWNKINSTISGGTGNLNGTGVTSMLYQNILNNGKTYKVIFTVSNYNGLGEARIIESSGSAIYTITSNGTFTFTFTHSNADGNFLFRARTGAIFSIDNVSVKEVIDGDFDFTRNSSATRVNSQGLIEDITSNLSRIDYTGGEGHWLFEPQSTNLIPYSEDFTEWTLGSSTSIESGYLAPDGSTNAYKVTGSLGALTLSGITNQTQTRTIWAKTVSGTGQAHLCSYFGNTNNIFTITSQWQRFEVNGTTTPTGNTTFYAIDFRGSTDLTEVILWGAQTEALSYPTSYIPTNGSTVTRLQDAAFGSGSSDLINSTEGVLYFEGERLSLLGSKRTICISDGSLNNYLYIQLQGVSNTVRIFYKTIETGQVLLLNHNLSNELEFRKYAFRWSNNNFSLWINGIKEIEQLNGNTATSSILNQINFSLGGGADKFFGKTKCLAVFKEALTDEELECLTTI